uniref:Lissencephaly-1 homolog n=1 Tax=Chromera velia CCMP2878 TaxID=1169474 RepID=A0A0G4FY98_9ALVE|eukprot:Cvel_3881.t1-p1 / transcript=Cvel_3881.t1 / gene=Cvel_3881 / organism=Chromera_velia_CCMP2878 / gene_product=Lissencephaly-1 homolog, putative / transcript_product=Lissencephaly-1 homolog, putative / location=Cvel_scaffold164:49877-59059(-) / protein_length=411 / sequence_SO=supercontig / SO=protein_coding / is_pseudo=false
MELISDSSRAELHAAIHQYLATCGFEGIAADFFEAAGLESQLPPPTEEMLVKRWICVSRLQTKMSRLESQLDEQNRQLQTYGSISVKKSSPEATIQSRPSANFVAHRRSVTALAFHPLFCLIATASEDCSIKLWDYLGASEAGGGKSDGGEGGEVKLERTVAAHTDVVNGLCFDPSGSRLASCSNDLTVKIFEVGGVELRRTLFGHDEPVSGVLFVGGGERLLSCSRDATIRLWETETGFCIRTFSIRLWDGDSESPIGELWGHTHVVERIEFLPSEALDRVGVASRHVADFNRHMKDEEANDNDAASALLVSASRDKSVKVWLVPLRQCVMTLSGHANWVRSVAAYPSGRFVLSSSDDRSLRLWDLSSGREVKKVEKAHDGFVSTLTLCPHSLLVATGGLDHRVRLWISS